MSFYSAFKPFGSYSAIPSIAAIRSATSAPVVCSPFLLQNRKSGLLNAQDVKNFYSDARVDAIVGAHAAGLGPAEGALLVDAVRGISQDAKVLEAIQNSKAYNSIVELIANNCSDSAIRDLPAATRVNVLKLQAGSGTLSEDVVATQVPADAAQAVKIICSSCYKDMQISEVQEAVRPTAESLMACSSAVHNHELDSDSYETVSSVGHAGNPGLQEATHAQELLDVFAPLATAAVVCTMLWQVAPNLAAVCFGQVTKFFGRLIRDAISTCTRSITAFNV